jgi:hypothetical protein
LKRHEQTKVALKSIESQYQNLVFILRRLYRDTFSVIQKMKGKPNKSSKQEAKMNNELYKFSDSLDILNLTPEEMQMFVDPKGNLLENVLIV